jgi:hypothetical protein
MPSSTGKRSSQAMHMTRSDALLLGDETALHTDFDYFLQATRQKLEQYGIHDQVRRKDYRGHPFSGVEMLRSRDPPRRSASLCDL